jgi:hypothetical protein
MALIRNIFRNNFLLISTFIFLFIIIGLVTVNFFSQMVDSEIQSIDTTQTITLNTSKNIIESRFINIKDNISFLSRIHSIKAFAYGNYRNANQKDNITKSFNSLIDNHNEIYNMKILDLSRKEVFRIVNNSYDSKQVKDIDSYIMTEVTFPLFDTKGVRKGQLISTISLFNMLDTIPK